MVNWDELLHASFLLIRPPVLGTVRLAREGIFQIGQFQNWVNINAKYNLSWSTH